MGTSHQTWRHVVVTDRKSDHDFAQCMYGLAEVHDRDTETVCTQLSRQPWRERDVTVLVALVWVDTQTHPYGIDIVELQLAKFSRAKPLGMGGHQQEVFAADASQTVVKVGVEFVAVEAGGRIATSLRSSSTPYGTSPDRLPTSDRLQWNGRLTPYQVLDTKR